MAAVYRQLSEYLLRFGNFGKSETGVTRVGFSCEYMQAACEVQKALRELGLHSHMDVFGNVHAIMEGERPNEKEILIGSHLDTVPDGGLYDGLLGVVYCVEMFRRLAESKRHLKHPLHMIAFNAEETGPFGGTFGSRAIAGLLPENAATKTLLGQLNVSAGDSARARLNFDHICCFLEPHIEQGCYLEKEHIDIGAVTGIYGIRRYTVLIKGEANHAGTTPMNARHDPMIALAKLILLIREDALNMGGELVATVGKVKVSPNLESVIPGEAEAVVEMRSLKSDLMDAMLKKIRIFADSVNDVDVKILENIVKLPAILPEKMVSAVEKACTELGYSCCRMPSGAGHDAKSLAAFVPTGMIFIPSVGGKSHCREEFSTENQIAAGYAVFEKTVEILDHC